MKKIVYVTALALGLGVTSCSQDLLDIPQKAAATTETFYKTDADAESSLIACYSKVQDNISGAFWNDGSGWGNPMTFLLNYSADDIYSAGLDATDHMGIREYDEFRNDPSFGWGKNYYRRMYEAIYDCNLVIDNNKGESDVINRCKAEARVLRAYIHMMLALSYDIPAIVDHLIQKDELPVNDKSQEEVLQWCIDECEAALPYLTERQGTDDQAGAYKVTKAFARFVAGKSAVFKGQGDWTTAMKYLKEVCEDPNYALVDGDHFYDLFHIAGNGNSEKIFEFHIARNDDAGDIIQWRGNWMGGDILSWRADLMAKGRPTIEAFPAWGGGAINHWFADKMYKNDGDGPRRKATFFTSDEFFYDETICPWPSDLTTNDEGETVSKGWSRAKKEADQNRGITTAAGMFARGLYLEHKKMPRPEDKHPDKESHLINFNVCRLAEAYLLYAEACFKGGNATEGKKYLNAVQLRAGTTATDITLEKIMDEKQYELWFENCRFHDLVRWDRQVGYVNGFKRIDDNTVELDYKATIKANFDAFTDYIPQCYDAFTFSIPLPNNGEGDQTVIAARKKQIEAMGLEKVKTIKTNDIYGYKELFGNKHELKMYVNHPLAAMGVTSRFEERNKYFPIPSDYMINNPSLKQNPLWE